MRLRSPRERIAMTLAFELGGLTLVAPVYGLIFGVAAMESLVLVASLSVAVMAWTPLHNAVWDRIELRKSGRPASARPHRLRLLHAISHEGSIMVVTLPLLMILGRHGLASAVLVDLGLSAFYALWAYVFYLAWDLAFPVAEQPAISTTLTRRS